MQSTSYKQLHDYKFRTEIYDDWIAIGEYFLQIHPRQCLVTIIAERSNGLQCIRTQYVRKRALVCGRRPVGLVHSTSEHLNVYYV